jgi:hypothetical protein
MNANQAIEVLSNKGLTKDGHQVLSCRCTCGKIVLHVAEDILHKRNLECKCETESERTFDFVTEHSASEGREKDLYFIFDTLHNTRVGRSAVLSQRLGQHQGSNTGPILMAKVWVGMGKYELYVHKELEARKYKLHGECYRNITPDTIDEVLPAAILAKDAYDAKKAARKKYKHKPGLFLKQPEGILSLLD